MVRICIFSRSFFPAIGGQERVAAVLAREFVQHGHSVVLLTDTISMELDDLPFEVRRTRKFLTRVAVFKEVDRVLFMSGSIQGFLGCCLAWKRCYVSHQSIYGIGAGLERVAGLLKVFLSRWTVNICISEFQRTRLRAPAVLIPNPVDQEFVQPLLPTKPRFDFVFVGRLVSDKGAALLIEAFSRLQGRWSNASLRVIGDGPELARLQAEVMRLGLGDRIVFSGALTGPVLASAVAECGCLVVPSLWEEPFGMAALEGLALCRHVIVTRRGALPEVVGRFGTVVNPDPFDLSLAMEHFLGSVRSGSEFDADKACYLERFSPNRVASQYLEVLLGEVPLR